MRRSSRQKHANRLQLRQNHQPSLTGPCVGASRACAGPMATAAAIGQCAVDVTLDPLSTEAGAVALLAQLCGLRRWYGNSTVGESCADRYAGCCTIKTDESAQQCVFCATGVDDGCALGQAGLGKKRRRRKTKKAAKPVRFGKWLTKYGYQGESRAPTRRLRLAGFHH